MRKRAQNRFNWRTVNASKGAKVLSYVLLHAYFNLRHLSDLTQPQQHLEIRTTSDRFVLSPLSVAEETLDWDYRRFHY